MKDKKRKYDLSYFMQNGGSPTDGSVISSRELKRRMNNLNNELRNLEEKKIEEEERRQQEQNEEKARKEEEDADDADFKQMLSESGFSSISLGKQILQESTESIKTAKPVSANFLSKISKNKLSFESASNIAKGVALSITQEEKQAAKQLQRETEYAKLKNEDIRKRLEVISAIQSEDGLNDKNLAIFIELYCGNQKKYSEIFDGFFDSKFSKFFREIDELKQRNISEKFSDQFIEVLAYKEENRKECLKFLKDITDFLSIFNRDTNFSNASNNIFIDYGKKLASYKDLTELNTKEIYEIFQILFAIKEWIKVTFGERIDIVIEVLPEKELQQRLNIFFKYLDKPEIKIEEIESLEDFEHFIGTNLKKIILLFSSDILFKLIRAGKIDEFIDKIKKFKESGIITEEEFEQINIILNDDSLSIEDKITKLTVNITKITTWYKQTIGYLSEYYKSAENKEKEGRNKRLERNREEEAAKRKLKNNAERIKKEREREEREAAEFQESLQERENHSGGAEKKNKNGFTKIPSKAEYIMLMKEKQARQKKARQEQAIQKQAMQKQAIQIKKSSNSKKSSSKANQSIPVTQSSPVRQLSMANRFKKSLLKPKIPVTQSSPDIPSSPVRPLSWANRFKKSLPKPTTPVIQSKTVIPSRRVVNEIKFSNIVKGKLPNVSPVKTQIVSPVQTQNASPVKTQNASPVKTQNASPVQKKSNEWQYQNSHKKFIRKQKAKKKANEKRKKEEEKKVKNTKIQEIKGWMKASEKNKKREERLKQKREIERQKEMQELKNITLKLFGKSSVKRTKPAAAAAAQNSKKESFVIMLSPHKTFGELTVFIDKKEINVKDILEIDDKIILLLNKILELRDLENKIKELKISLFEILIESGFEQTHKISDLILNLLNKYGLSELFINYYLNQYNLEDLKEKIIKILKKHLCEIDNMVDNDYFKEQLTRLAERAIEESLRAPSQLFIAFDQSKKNPSQSSISFFPKLARLIKNASVSGNSGESLQNVVRVPGNSGEKSQNVVSVSGNSGESLQNVVRVPGNSGEKSQNVVSVSGNSGKKSKKSNDTATKLRTRLDVNVTLSPANIAEQQSKVVQQAAIAKSNSNKQNERKMELFKSDLRGRIRELKLNKDEDKKLPTKLISKINKELRRLPNANMSEFKKLLSDQIVTLKNKYSGPKLAEFVKELENLSKPASTKVVIEPVKSVKSVKPKKLNAVSAEFNNSAIKANFEREIQDATTQNQLKNINARIKKTKTKKTTQQPTRISLRELLSKKEIELETAEQIKLAKLKEDEQRTLTELKSRISRLKLQENGSLPNSNIASILESPLFHNNESITEMLEEKIGKLQKKIREQGIKNTKTRRETPVATSAVNNGNGNPRNGNNGNPRNNGNNGNPRNNGNGNSVNPRNGNNGNGNNGNVNNENNGNNWEDSKSLMFPK